MAEKTHFNAGLVQMSMTADPDKNLEKAVHWIEEAARQKAEVVCLPELFRTPYLCQEEDTALFEFAEAIPGPTTDKLGEAAKQLKIVIVASLFERRAAGLYHNSVAVIDTRGVVIGLYRKMHIPDDPGFYEKFYFTPGDLGFKAFDTEAGRIGTLICWDQWYPEGARLTALQGASILFYPTAIGWHPSEKDQYGHAQRDSWQTVQRGHAISNGVYVAAINRIGHESPSPDTAGIEFWGTSFICDPQGVILAQASTDQEEVLVTEVDLKKIEDIRRNWPFLRDRRIDAYQGIQQRFLNDENWK